MDAKPSMAGAVAAVLIIVAATSLLAVVGRQVPDLTSAVTEGNHEQVRILLGRGADPNKPTVNGFTPLMRAAIRDDGPMVQLLVESGADLEETSAVGGMTPLHAAAIADSSEAITVLVEAGADVGARSRSGRRAMDHAASAGAVNAIRVLAAAGADLNARSGDKTQTRNYPTDVGPPPLAIAARAGHLQAIEVLLDLGADVDAKSEAGHTALLQAIASGQPTEMVAVLLEAGADPEIRISCMAGCSLEDADAVAWARELERSEVLALLEDTTTA